MTNSELLINSALGISWATAHDLRLPAYWSGIMSEIDGCQNMLIALDRDNVELVDDLTYLWKIALRRRSMAYEAEAE